MSIVSTLKNRCWLLTVHPSSFLSISYTSRIWSVNVRMIWPPSFWLKTMKAANRRAVSLSRTTRRLLNDFARKKNPFFSSGNICVSINRAHLQVFLSVITTSLCYHTRCTCSSWASAREKHTTLLSKHILYLNYKTSTFRGFRALHLFHHIFFFVFGAKSRPSVFSYKTFCSDFPTLSSPDFSSTIPLVTPETTQRLAAMLKVTSGMLTFALLALGLSFCTFVSSFALSLLFSQSYHC